jgi:hypothetical protein
MPIVKHLIGNAAFSSLEGLRLCAVARRRVEDRPADLEQQLN